MMIDGKQSISDALDLIEEAFESIKNISLKNFIKIPLILMY